MLKEAVEKLMVERDIPLVWRGMERSPYASHRSELDSHRNDGKVSYEQQEEVDDMEMDMDAGEDDMMDMEWSDEMEMDQDGEFGDLDDEEDDPDRQGLIRVVPNAHLVYKRATEEGTFDELWIYNVGEDFTDELETRRGILAGTDIEMNRMRSEDGSQRYELWNAGNAQLLHITGLPS